MKAISNTKVSKNKITAFVLALCIVISFVPTVLAESSSSENEVSSGRGFENVEQDGGTLFIGTARIPKSNSDSTAAVKYIYSDGLILNKKSFELIRSELKYFGIDIPENFTVSGSDVSNNNNISSSQNRQAIFACGSEENPTELTPYQPYESVEKSFDNLFKGYIFSISGYTSLKNILEGRDEIKISEDGKTAQTSIVMDEDYVEKVINGKTVTILMINSELKYSLRAPKMTFIKDENYIASASDIVSPDTSSSETDGNAVSTTASSAKITAGASPEITSIPQTASSLTEPTVTSSSTAATTSATTVYSAKITADASPEFTSASQADCSTVQTSYSSTEFTTTSGSVTVAVSTTTASSEKITADASPEFTSASQMEPSVARTSPTSTESTTASTNPMFDNATKNTLLSQRGIVNTRRLPLNIRSGPGTNYMVVTVLPKGTYVTVLDTTNSDWYMVKTMGKVVGYAYSKYIKLM